MRARRLETNQAILVSVRPNHASKIVCREKTTELRRRFAHISHAGARLYLYATRPVKAVIGYAQIAAVERGKPAELWERHGYAACVDRATFERYFAGSTHGYALLLEEAGAFEQAIGIERLRADFGFRPPQSFMYVKQDLRWTLDRAIGPEIHNSPQPATGGEDEPYQASDSPVRHFRRGEDDLGTAGHR